MLIVLAKVRTIELTFGDGGADFFVPNFKIRMMTYTHLPWVLEESKALPFVLEALKKERKNLTFCFLRS